MGLQLAVTNPVKANQGGALEVGSRGRLGFLHHSGYPGKVPSGNPADIRSLGCPWGAAPVGRDPYLREDRQGKERSRRGACADLLAKILWGDKSPTAHPGEQ